MKINIKLRMTKLHNHVHSLLYLTLEIIMNSDRMLNLELKNQQLLTIYTIVNLNNYAELNKDL